MHFTHTNTASHIAYGASSCQAGPHFYGTLLWSANRKPWRQPKTRSTSSCRCLVMLIPSLMRRKGFCMMHTLSRQLQAVMLSGPRNVCHNRQLHSGLHIGQVHLLSFHNRPLHSGLHNRPLHLGDAPRAQCLLRARPQRCLRPQARQWQRTSASEWSALRS